MPTLAATTVLLVLVPCAVLLCAALGIGTVWTLRGAGRGLCRLLSALCVVLVLGLALAGLYLAEWGGARREV